MTTRELNQLMHKMAEISVQQDRLTDRLEHITKRLQKITGDLTASINGNVTLICPECTCPTIILTEDEAECGTCGWQGRWD